MFRDSVIKKRLHLSLWVSRKSAVELGQDSMFVQDLHIGREQPTTVVSAVKCSAVCFVQQNLTFESPTSSSSLIVFEAYAFPSGSTETSRDPSTVTCRILGSYVPSSSLKKSGAGSVSICLCSSGLRILSYTASRFFRMSLRVKG